MAGCCMRTGITTDLNATDRRHLGAIVADRNTPQKHVWRAQIILLTAEGCGTEEVMRRTGTAKTTVWHWQERFMRGGVDPPVRWGQDPHKIIAVRRRWH